MTRFWTLLIGIAMVSPAFAGDAKPVLNAVDIPVSDFFKDSVFREAVLSPNGKYVLDVNYADPDHEYVTLIDLVKEQSIDLIAAADKNEYFSGLAWVSDNTAAFYDHFNSMETKLVAVRWDGYKDGKPQSQVTVWPGSYWILDRLIHEGGQVLMARDEGSGTKECICIYRVDINAGPDKVTKDEQVYSVDPKEKFLLTDKDGKLTVMETRDDKDVRHFLRYSPAGADGKHWTEFKHIDDDKIVFKPKLVAPDGHNLYVFTNIGHERIGYYEYDPDSDKIVRTIYANDQADLDGSHYDALTESLTYVLWYAGTDPHYEILDDRARSYLPALRLAFPAEQVVPWGISQGGDELLVYVYSDVNSGAYYAYNVKKREAQLLGAEQPWLDPKLMSQEMAGSIKTKDGFTVTYLITVPKHGQAPYPLVVIPHGGPIGVFNVNSFDPETQLLASRGYAVLKVNYRGSGGGSKDFENAGKHQWGRKIEDDIEEAVRTVLHTEPVDANRICIYGASYGGYSALMSIIRDPALYKCAASYAGVTDLPLLYDTTFVQYDKEVRDDMADIIGDPTTDAEQLHAVSPVYQAAKITRPVLLAQGGQDPRVDKEQAFRLKLVMDTLKKPVEFQFYPEEGHGFFKNGDKIDFYTRLLDFLDRNIGEKSSAAQTPTR